MNLIPQINLSLNKLEELLKNSNWIRKDWGYWEYKPNSRPNLNSNFCLPGGYVSFAPDILYFDKDHKSWAEIWLKFHEFDLTEDSKNELFSIVKPFKDEDYRGNKFWINPFYPNGYWNNHALD